MSQLVQSGGEFSPACTHCALVLTSLVLYCTAANITGVGNQALTGTRYPTRPGLFFSYPNRTRNFFQNFRVQGSSYICYY